MNFYKQKIVKFSAIAIGAFLGLSSCSKKDISSSSSSTDPTITSTSTLYAKIFAYAKQTYYWNYDLPDSATFLPESYASSTGTDSLAKATNEIFKMTRYAVNPSTLKSYEYYDDDGDTTAAKYSYIEASDAEENNSTSYVTTAGIGNDLGFYIASGNYLNVLYPRVIFNNSPAYNAGVKRGNIIYKVNGSTFNLAKSADITTLNAALNASSITFTIADSTADSTITYGGSSYNGKKVLSSHTVTLTKTQYTSNPILKDTTWTINSTKIGYLALLNFASQSVLNAKLTSAFSTFATNGISYLIVDLRYNGGGYVATSQQLADLIAPSTYTGKTMFYMHYNETMRNGNASLLALQGEPTSAASYSDANNTYKFGEISSSALSLKNVIFLVGSGTASASELLINNLKPLFANYQIISTTLTSTSSYKPATANTYGKPVGFFPITVNSYDMYMPNFISINSQGDSVSYSGFTPNITDWDDVTHDLGNPLEDATAQALNYILNGSYVSTSTKIGSKTAVTKTSTSTSSTSLSASSLNSLMYIKSSVSNSIGSANDIKELPKDKFKFNSGPKEMVEDRKK